MKEKLILAVDAAIEHGSLSLMRGKKEVDSLIFASESSRSVDLLPGIQGLIERRGLDINSLGLLAVSKIHGSLTGLRVASATLRGLSDALGLEIIEYDLPEIIASQIPSDGEIRIVGLPVGKNSAQWFLADGQKKEIYSIGREVRETESLIRRFSETGLPLIYVHEILFAVVQQTKFAGCANIRNLGSNMARHLAVEAVK